MKNKFVIPVLLISLIATAGWGYTQFQAKRQWEVNAENQYQRAFEELTGGINNLETELSKSLVAASFPQSLKLLTNIWREANSCQEELGQLPVTSLELSRTKMFLAKAGAFCFNTAQEKLIEGTDIDEGEWGTLKELRDQCRLVTRHLTDMRQNFFAERASWVEVDQLGPIGATSVARDDNKIAKAFLMLEDGLRRVPDVEFEGNNLEYVPKPTGLTGEKITAQQAVAKARQLLGPEYEGARFKYESLIKSDFPTYMISVTDPKNPQRDLRCSISQKGGHMAWLLGNRAVTSDQLSREQAQVKAQEFCKQIGYPNMKVVASEEYANVLTCTLAAERNGVIYYPELIKVQVARDNGEIIGMDAIACLTFREPTVRAASTGPQNSQITQQRLRQTLNPHLKVDRIQQAQVLDEMYNKVNCYEVDGTQGTDRFLIYYNANNGREEKIRRVDQYGNEIQ